MSQLLIKIVAIGTKKIFLVSILYGGHNSPNSLNIMPSTHTLNLICHKGYYFFQVISKKIKMQKIRILIILVLNASIATRLENSNC
jgi:hypothetical protein